MKRMTLIYHFLESLMLINKRIIKYAWLSIRFTVIERQPVDRLNNPDLLTDREDDNKEIVFGAYEADYCCDFAKLIRKEFCRNFLKTNGTFKIVFDLYHTYPFHERLFRFMLQECGFKYERVCNFDRIVYIAH